jgi:hypothetical protein
MRALILLLIAANALVACTDLTGPPPEIYAPMCSANSDCPGALKCSSVYAICHDASPLDKDVAVQLTPPANSGLVQDQRASVSFHGSNQFNATLDDAISVKGRILEENNLLSASVPGQIIAETDGDIPGTVLQTQAFASEGVSEEGHAFTLDVIPGRPYRISIFPSDTDRPPHFFWETFQFGEDELLIVIPQMSGAFSYPTIRGSILDATEIDEDGNNEVLEEVEVVALRIPSWDDPMALPYVSSSSVTDSKLGMFNLRVGTEPADYRLFLAPTGPTPSGKILPHMLTDVEAPIHIDGELGSLVNLGALHVEPLPAVPAILHVVGSTPDGIETPLAKATLTLHAQLGEEKSHTVHAQTSDDPLGVWQGLILQGTYTAIVDPPPGSKHGRITTEITVDAANPSHTIVLGIRTLVTGTVTSWNGASVADCIITALNDNGETTMDLPPQVVTAGDGTWSLSLDPSDYTFVVAPSPATPHPRYVTESRTIEGLESAQPIALPPPHIVHGLVTDTLGEPAADVTISLYESTLGESAIIEPLGDQRHLLGEGITDDLGRYQLLVPSSDGTPP